MISICDSFPLPHVKEALQAVHAAIWFSSFDLAQAYLQMAMEEVDIPKTAFHAGSSGLYEFTRMPFGLTNAGASYCHLMEMCIGDQQYVTLLFYLDDICIFAEMADQMLDRIKLVFSCLKEFNLKIKPKKSYFFQTSVNFLGHILSAKGVLPNPEKVAKVRDWPVKTWMAIPSKSQQAWSVYLIVLQQKKWWNINARTTKSHQSSSMLKKTKNHSKSLLTKSGQNLLENLLYNETD